MNLELKGFSVNNEPYNKKLLLDVVKRILMIGEKDKNISLQSKYNRLDEKILHLKEKDLKYSNLLVNSLNIKSEINEKLNKLNSLNESMKENLLEMVGGEL
jgi:reverse gyrase